MDETWPVGEAVDWKPAHAPERSALIGSTVRLEPLDPIVHAQPLFSASHRPDADPHLWDYMSFGPFRDQAEFEQWLQSAARSADPLFFAIVDLASSLPSGVASYMRITPQHGVIEIGNIWFGSRLQRTRQATEAIFLLARHTFDDLGFRRLEWKCNALNERSRRAAERFGFSYEGTFRQHMVVKGRNRDTAWYAMIDREWPAIRAAFERWLATENFYPDGKQIRSLASIRGSIQAETDANRDS